METDQAMNQDIMVRGNDARAMHTYMDDSDVVMSHARRGFRLARDIYPTLPNVSSPENQLKLKTEYAVVSSKGDLGVTYGAWNSRFTDDSTRKSDQFFDSFVFGFNSGLWTATWSPRGAPRVMHHEYVRVWKRVLPDGGWRLVGGTFPLERLAAPADDPPVLAAPHAVPAGWQKTPAQARKEVLDADHALSAVSSTHGALAAYTRYAAVDVRLMRDFDATTAGLAELRKSFERHDALIDLQPRDAFVSAPDLVCTYGLMDEFNRPGKIFPSGIYLHVWEPSPDGWKLALVYLTTFD